MLRVLKPLTVRLLGPPVAFQVGVGFFWSFLLAIVAVLGGRIETGWLFYTVAVGGGLFIGLMYGSTNPYAGNEDAWLGLAGLPLGALATWSAATVQRGFDASAESPLVGGVRREYGGHGVHGADGHPDGDADDEVGRTRENGDALSS